MRFRTRKPPRKPFTPPANTKAGAAAILRAAVNLYDRQNGGGADRQAMGEALFKAAFEVLDKLPEDQKRQMARRVHADSYNCAVVHAGITTPGNESPERDADAARSMTADYRPPL